MPATHAEDEALIAGLVAHLAQVLDVVPPGGALAAAVEDADDLRTDLSSAALVDLAASCQRLVNWALARQGTALVELVNRFEGPPGYVDTDGTFADLARASAVTDVALAAGLSEYAVTQRLVVALGVPERLPRVHALLTAGAVEFAKVKAVHDAVVGLSPDQTEQVESEVLDAAVQGTLAGLRRALERAVLRHAPDVAAQRAAEAARCRAVRFSALEDGSALMSVEAPAPRIAAAEVSLNLLAQAVIATAEADDERTVDAVRADVVLDLIESAADALSAGSPPDSEPTPPAPGRRVRGRTQLVVTVPLATLLGLSEEPGLLDGYGPIAAAMAREVAGAATDGTWLCAVTDDRPGHVHGTLLGLGRSTFSPGYVPPRATWRFVTVRDGTCRFPGCHRRAERCDLDHRVRHRDGGATCECNLQALCRRHHRLKHETPLRVSHDCVAGSTWSTRTGHEYRAAPPTLPHAVVPHSGGDPPPF